MYPEPRYLDAGEAALMVEFADEISPQANALVHWLAATLRLQPVPGLGVPVPAYSSLLVQYDPLRLGRDRLRRHLQIILARPDAGTALARPTRLRQIPAAFGGEYGPDLAAVAALKGLDEAELVRQLCEVIFTVYMVGFLPGFPYLGTLPESLAVPRLTEPRLTVPQGSVAIAGRQAGIYPFTSPGGWQLLGRTPYQMFDPHRDPPAYLAPGDGVRFLPVAMAEYEGLAKDQPWC
ncbi:MAG: 5-oxoprolinase subunit PxpB [Chloroflexi bacterium]|nr:5-oxoprolinase subunit PxpB [Chloroflexota bacterium]MCL5109907.1 5-oxoprolinase subunit PxpB [Chloroflexota bacterium]